MPIIWMFFKTKGWSRTIFIRSHLVWWNWLWKWQEAFLTQALYINPGFHWLGDPAEPTDLKYAPNFALLKIWLSKFGAIHSHSATFSKTLQSQPNAPLICNFHSVMFIDCITCDLILWIYCTNTLIHICPGAFSSKQREIPNLAVIKTCWEFSWNSASPQKPQMFCWLWCYHNWRWCFHV